MGSIPTTADVQLDNLSERGRGQYFYHDSNSELPVRDISGREKTEPYIEYGREFDLNSDHIVGAENYCSECYQGYIQSFLESDRKYLFLMTTPQNRDMDRQIVGYMEKDDFDDQGSHITVVGKTFLYDFEDAIPAREIGKGGGRSGHLFDEEETQTVLEHFKGCEDVTEECLEEVLQLKEEEGQDTDNDQFSCGCCQ